MKNITIGRDDSCDIIINNERVSRFHANIMQQGNGYVYRDTSSNGTLINGSMVRNSERYVNFGDQVLLAGTIPLPWNRIQSMTPTSYSPAPYSDRDAYGRERAYYPAPEKGYYDDRYEPPITYSTGTGLIIFGYIFAFLGGWLAFIFGSILINSKQTVNGKKVNKYKPSSVTNGWVIITIAAICFIIYWIIIISNK